MLDLVVSSPTPSAGVFLASLSCPLLPRPLFSLAVTQPGHDAFPRASGYAASSEGCLSPPLDTCVTGPSSAREDAQSTLQDLPGLLLPRAARQDL